VAARQKAREAAAAAGFTGTDLTLIATAVSEIARNIVKFAHRGQFTFTLLTQGHRTGLLITARDSGPGIPDLDRALRDGYSTYRGLGIGLPGARRLMDQFDILSEVGKGTTVVSRPDRAPPRAGRPPAEKPQRAAAGVDQPDHRRAPALGDDPARGVHRGHLGLAVSFVEERERVIREQADALRELSTPVLQVRERLLILPIIGVLDTARAHQLTDQLLRAIRRHRALVVVIDITGVADVDEPVANHLVQTVDASRLMGASVIITGLSSEIAQTLVTIGVDLSKISTVGDLQGGIEEAEHLLGFTVVRTNDARR
jgi:anti-sigma regulatory factor (Ser/Thr protein kinase)/anti-anti-sigma regulatory factor